MNQKLPDGADPADPRSYAAYAGKAYAPDLIAERARAFIRDNKDRPFFLFLPTTVPHLALQVPEDSLAEYRGLWPDPPYHGGQRLPPERCRREPPTRRWSRAWTARSGASSTSSASWASTSGPSWSSRRDNGPTYERIGGSDSEFFRSAGAAARAQGLALRGWRPRARDRAVEGEDPGRTGQRPRDRLRGLAADAPGPGGRKEAIPQAIDGLSFAPTLLGQAQEPRPFLYREFPGYGGQQSIRVGDWKGVRQGLEKPGPKRARALRPEARRRRGARRGGRAPRRGGADGGAPRPGAPAVGGVPDPRDRRGNAPLRRVEERGHRRGPCSRRRRGSGQAPRASRGDPTRSPRAFARSPPARGSRSATT